MQRAMARQAEAEREERAKIIAAEGEALAARELAPASDVMMAHPLALQLRNLQTLVGVAADKNPTVVFPGLFMGTISGLGVFLSRETQAAAALPPPPSLSSLSGDAARQSCVYVSRCRVRAGRAACRRARGLRSIGPLGSRVASGPVAGGHR
jgi:hypothetical protein